MKVFLIGFMGCGKSAIGKMLAEKMNIDFVETDKLVETLVGKDIPSIFNFDGEKIFRKAENEILDQLIQKPHKEIISTGGGMPCYFENMKLMNFFGTTIFLKRSVDDLYSILQNDKKHRPLLSDQPDLKSAIETMLKKREGCYHLAKHIVEINLSESNSHVVDRIIQLLEGNL